MPFTIRQAVPTDLDTVVRYNHRLADESEGIALDLDRLRLGVAAVLGDPGKGRYFLAVENGATVGQVMITYEWSDWRNGCFWWLQSVYVEAEHRRRGVFRALFEHVNGLVEADPEVCGLRLYVEKDNAHAQQTYAAMGLRTAPYAMMQVDHVID